jgi:hypothetical protein
MNGDERLRRLFDDLAPFFRTERTEKLHRRMERRARLDMLWQLIPLPAKFVAVGVLAIIVLIWLP